MASEIGGNFRVLLLIKRSMDLLELVVVLDSEETVHIVTSDDERIGVQVAETDLVNALVHCDAEAQVGETLLLIPQPDDELVVGLTRQCYDLFLVV